MSSVVTDRVHQERAIRSLLKSYRSRLAQEIVLCNKAMTKYRKKTLDQSSEYEKQEQQLISWGLKTALPKFHMQAWYRLERCRIYEDLAKEITRFALFLYFSVRLFLLSSTVTSRQHHNLQASTHPAVLTTVRGVYEPPGQVFSRRSRGSHSPT